MKKLILFISFITLSLLSHATIHVVDSLNNSGTGSLRSKVALASSGDTIRFNPNLIANGSDSIVLTTEIAFSKSLRFIGLYSSIDTLFLSGGGTNRIFNLTLTSTLHLDSVVIINSLDPQLHGGGAVRASGLDSLFVNNSVFRNNKGYNGGAIYFYHWLGNTFVKVENSVFKNNIANGIYAKGGAIYVNCADTFRSELQVFESKFISNKAPYQGGAVWCGGNGISKRSILNAVSCTFSKNHAYEGSGLAVHNNNEAILRLVKSTVNENADSSIYGFGSVFCFSYYGYARMEIEESTVVDNSCDSCVGAGVSVRSTDSTSALIVVNSTINNNFSSLSYGAGIHVYPQINSVVEIQGSIISNNYPSNFSSHVIPFVSQGYNIFSDSVISGLTTDQFNVDSTSLNLGVLAFNGGNTPTMMPIFPSVAIDMGNPLDSSDAQNAHVNGIRDVGAAEVCFATYATDTIVACDSYTWINGVTYTSNDTSSIFAIPNTAGCDSIITLNLTINLSSTFTDTISTCNSHTWIDGNTYYQSNYTATHTLVNAAGCDSLVTLNLTISNTYFDTITACNSYTWRNGITYSQSSFGALDTVVVSGGCDSLFVLDLTITNTEYTTDFKNVCDSLTWINGITYYSSTTVPKDTLINQFGCDSIVTLDLTITNSIHDTDHVLACLIYTWSNGQVYLSSNNTATQVFNALNGCDSILHLDLEINYGTIATDTHVVCDSLVWIDGNTYYTNNTTALHTLVAGNSNGCDSLVTLNLTISSSQTTDVISSCDAITWIDGNTYSTNNNTAMYTSQNALGCDSMVTLDYTRLTNTTGTNVVSACESYTWNGITYTTNNNTALDTLVNAAGCDSIVTLDLTILNSSTGIDVISSCSPITWIDGNTYSANNNMATHTLVNAVGCDSIITLVLTILQSTSGTDVINSCTEIIWIDGITYNQSTNGVTFTIPNSQGCDSIVTLDLTITEVETSVYVDALKLAAIAQNATYQWLDCNDNFSPIVGETSREFSITQSGNYAVEVTENGCSDTSACYEFLNVSIQEPELIGISLYPNPTSDVLNIDKGTNTSLEITITNSAGAMVHQSNTQNQITTINMAQMATGMYVVTLKNELGMKVEKVVKR